jgi:ADP-ribosylglycohydrolase
LAAGRRDLRAVAHRWVERSLAHPDDLSPETAAALAHLARHDAPPSEAAGRGSDPLVRVLPVAVVAWQDPRTLVSATYHLVALTHPDPVVQWAAVAVNVALGRLLSGQRDFVADVIEVLRANGAPPEVVAAARTVPLTSPGDPGPGAAVADAAAALRLAYHEPVLVRGVAPLRDGGPAAADRAGLAGALLGARDGAARVPTDWLPAADRANFQRLAERLVGVQSAPADRA